MKFAAIFIIVLKVILVIILIRAVIFLVVFTVKMTAALIEVRAQRKNMEAATAAKVRGESIASTIDV